jgi:ankyrin repeat protein
MYRYKYSPLDLGKRSFRLVRLIKGNEGPIQCEIINAQFDDKEDIIPYDALSYTWGDQNNLREIEVHRTTFHVDVMVLSVTENLHVALQRLRRREDDRILWIDAICIDQGNPKERGHQVEQMSSIYEQATKVVFWLGKSTLVTPTAFEYMRRLQKEAHGHACNSWAISDERWRPLWRNIRPLLSNRHDSWDEFLREGFKDLLARAWFRRAWIIQEVAQARTAEVMCGAQSTSARIFAVTASLLKMETEHHCQAILDIMPGPSRETSWWARKRDLRTLLYKFRKSKRSDARDAVYSLLGVSSDKNADDFPSPDYSGSERNSILKSLQYFVRFNGIEVDRHDLPWWRMDHFLEDMPWLESELFKWMVVQGLMDVPKMLLETDQVKINSEDRHGSTLLEWATREKREKTVNLLQGSCEGKLEAEPATTYEATNPQQLDTDEIEVDSPYEDELAPRSLLWAANTGNEAICKQLLNTDDVDVKINRSDQNGSTPLSWAARSGHGAIVQLLLNTDRIDINLEDRNGASPLLWAARNGHNTVVKLLLCRFEVDANACDRNGATPLSWAARNGHNTVVQSLLDTEEIDVDLEDRNGSTPLSWAARFGHNTVVQLLLGTEEIDLYPVDRTGLTPIHWAARFGHDTVVHSLLDTEEIMVNLTDLNRSTPLSWAARFGHDTVVQLLLDTEEIAVNQEDQEGLTPLHWAARNGHNAIVKLLFKGDYSTLHSQDQNGLTPLLWASRNGHNTVVELIISFDFMSVYETDQNGLTAMHWAARNGHNTIVELLFQRSYSTVRVQDQYGFTPLLWASRNGHNTVVELMLSFDFMSVYEKDRLGWTAMHWAARNGHDTIVKLLIHVGATDNHLENQDWLSLLSWAREKGYNEAANLLLEEHEIRSMYQIDSDLFSP